MSTSSRSLEDGLASRCGHDFNGGGERRGGGEKEGRFLPASLNTARKPSLRTLPEFYFFHQLGDPLFFLRLASSDRPKFLAFSKKKKN